MVNLVIAGIAQGAIYAMMALGFALLWQTSRTINFAQGDFATVSAFTFIGATAGLGLSVLPAAVVTVLVSALVLGLFVRYTIIRRLLGKGLLTLIMSTIMVQFIIQNGFLVFVTGRAIRPEPLVANAPVSLGGVTLSLQALANLGIAGLMVLLVSLYLKYTKGGKALRAVAQNSEVASILGIRVDKVITRAFVINGCLVAFAAILISPLVFVTYDMGIELGLKAFYSAIIGGFNEIRGALLGGLLVGVIETLTAAYISVAYNTGIVLLLLIAVILVKPEGLWGTRDTVETT